MWACKDASTSLVYLHVQVNFVSIESVFLPYLFLKVVFEYTLTTGNPKHVERHFLKNVNLNQGDLVLWWISLNLKSLKYDDRISRQNPRNMDTLQV